MTKKQLAALPGRPPELITELSCIPTKKKLSSAPGAVGATLLLGSSSPLSQCEEEEEENKRTKTKQKVEKWKKKKTETIVGWSFCGFFFCGAGLDHRDRKRLLFFLTVFLFEHFNMSKCGGLVWESSC